MESCKVLENRRDICTTYRVCSTVMFVLIAVVFLTPNGSSALLNSSTLEDSLNKHDRRFRPNHGGSPVNVSIGIHVESLSAIKESTMDYSMTIFFRLYWEDARLAFDGEQYETFAGDDMNNIWIPDIFFLYEKNAKHHDVTVTNRMLKVFPNGGLWMSTRITLMLACNMNLVKFPMDRQRCSVEMMSYAYTTRDVVLVVKKEDMEVEDKLEIPRFKLTKHYTDNTLVTYSTGNFSCAIIHFEFARQLQSYVLTVYVPSVLLVIIAWLSFWIDAEAAPARVSVGVTTVLTVTTMTSGIQETLPIVTYAKAMDVWLFACLLFVFCSLLEYAFANYLLIVERRRFYKRNRKKQPDASFGRGNGSSPGAAFFAFNYELTFLDINRGAGAPIWTARYLDKVSRWIFPIAFVGFNLFYWPFYLLTEDN
ncbi:glycine receptor subunit alphaZ1-like isoform X2 [Amphiura filiformis]|uniref:glycine receptor subunit alphaZ1-like isoform X2 n=1 Tax=Amphiura filiformis TaxID=82378 RepID=UPI003B221E1B